MLLIGPIRWDWAISCSRTHAQKGARHVKTIKKDVLLAALNVAQAGNGPLAARNAALARNGQHATHKDVLAGNGAQLAARKGAQAETGNQQAAKKGTLAGNGVPPTSADATAAAALSSRRNGNGASSFMTSSRVIGQC